MDLAVAPVRLGSGERLVDGLNLATLGYEAVDSVSGENAVHYLVRRTRP